jgi:hypothetical protein
MNKTCEACVAIKICPSPARLVKLVLGWAQEEGTNLDALSQEDYNDYVITMLDEFVKYKKGHVTPSVIAYVKKIMTENKLSGELSGEFTGGNIDGISMPHHLGL